MIRDLKDIIDSREDLLAEKQRLKAAVKMHRATIRNSFTEIRDELNPFSVFTNENSSLQTIFKSMSANPLVSQGLAAGTELLLKKLYPKRSGFLQRLILPIVIKKVSEFIAAPRVSQKLADSMHTAADTLRKVPKIKPVKPPIQNNNSRNHESETVSEENPAVLLERKPTYRGSKSSKNKIATQLRLLAARIRQ